MTVISVGCLYAVVQIFVEHSVGHATLAPLVEEKRRKWFEIVAIRCHDVTQWIMGKYPRPSWDDGQNCAEGSQPSQ